jgi:hypothetical protein
MKKRNPYDRWYSTAKCEQCEHSDICNILNPHYCESYIPAVSSIDMSEGLDPEENYAGQ